MNREDIESAIAVGAHRCAYLHRERVSCAPGYVRTISLHSGHRVQIAYEVEGLDEGGACFWATYPSLDAALRALEELFLREVREWALPDLEEVATKMEPDHEALARSIQQGILPFPPGAEYRLQPGYWSRFQ